MNEVKRLLDYMEKHKEEFIEVLKGAVILESPTEGDKDSLNKCRDYFSKIFSELGAKCTVVPSNDVRYGDHLLIELGDGDEQILFVGHYDTVYPIGTFGETWKRDNTRIWGPGVLDMKGGNIQVFYIVKALKELKLLPDNKKIVFFLSSDEEAGSYSSNKHYKELASLSKAAFVMESTRGDYIGGVKIGRYGRGNYTLVAEGKSAHSGQEPENAESGLIELAKQAIYLENLTDISKGLTVACTCLKSGDAGWPTVPGYAELTIDARFASVELAEEFDRLINNIKPFNPKVKIKTNGGIEKPPFDENDPKHKGLYELAKEVGSNFGIDIKGYVTRGGSDGNFTSSVGCPTLDGLGLSGDFVHQPGREYINIDHIALRSAFVAQLVHEVLRK